VFVLRLNLAKIINTNFNVLKYVKCYIISINIDRNVMFQFYYISVVNTFCSKYVMFTELDANACHACSDKCTNCKSLHECLNCGAGFEVVKGECMELCKDRYDTYLHQQMLYGATSQPNIGSWRCECFLAAFFQFL